MKKLLIGLLTLLLVISFTGCGTKKNEANTNDNNKKSIREVEGNTRVGALLYYVPGTYKYMPELRGLIYNENEKKVHVYGDYENDKDNCIYLIAVAENKRMELFEYAQSVNSKLSDDDIKFSVKMNSKKSEIFAREKYVINGKINYAYILGYAGDIYTVNIQGPKDKETEMKSLARDLYNSLYISK